jgi:hypothetical protein
MEHFIEILKTIIWPFTIVALIIYLRRELKGLFSRVSTLKYKDIEAHFEKELLIAEKKAEKMIESSKTNKIIGEEPIYPEPFDEKYEQLLRISEESPRAAILEGWTAVEHSIYKAAERFNVRAERSKNIRRVISELIDTGNYAKTVYPLVMDLYELRNQVAHTVEFSPSKKFIKRYLQLTIEMDLTFKNPLNMEE